MSQRYTVRGQEVTRDRIRRAKELRQNMTGAEKILWQNLRADRLDGWHFRRQQIIHGFIVDFYCHALSLIIEVDGAIHGSQVEADQDRDRALAKRGFHVVRFHNEEILNQLPKVLQQISMICKEYSKQQPDSPPHLGEGPGERSK